MNAVFPKASQRLVLLVLHQRAYNVPQNSPAVAAEAISIFSTPIKVSRLCTQASLIVYEPLLGKVSLYLNGNI